MKMFLVLLMTMGSLANAKNIELTPSNSITLRNEINDNTISKLQEELAMKVVARGMKTYTIYLVLDSPGGSIDSGLNFIEFAKTVPNLETVTLFAASMASAIVEALPGKRNIVESGVLMFHRARGGVQGQFENGELESRLDMSKKTVRIMEQKNADRMSLSLDVYKSKVVNELWILGNEAVKDKAADEVVSISCSAALVTSRSVETFEAFMGMTFDVMFSSCPLIKAGKVIMDKDEALYNQFKAKKLSFGSVE